MVDKAIPPPLKTHLTPDTDTQPDLIPNLVLQGPPGDVLLPLPVLLAGGVRDHVHRMKVVLLTLDFLPPGPLRAQGWVLAVGR